MREFITVLGVVLFIGMVGWGPGGIISRNKEPLVEVTLVEAHWNQGTWSDPSSYAIYERTDTRERKMTNLILGKSGDKFRVRWSDL